MSREYRNPVRAEEPWSLVRDWNSCHTQKGIRVTHTKGNYIIHTSVRPPRDGTQPKTDPGLNDAASILGHMVKQVEQAGKLAVAKYRLQ